MEQGFYFSNDQVVKDIINFLKDRFKYYLKEKNIRHDIIEAAINTLNLNSVSLIFEKTNSLNKVINKQIGLDIISSYKRASNILNTEIKDFKSDLSNSIDTNIFKNEYEKDLFKKTSELKKHMLGISYMKSFEETLFLLSSSKKEVFAFFDNVKVNDDSESIKKNRLELINFFCKTCENFINFQLIKDIND